MSERTGMHLDPPLCAAIPRRSNSLIESMGKSNGEVRFMRDPTREGLQQP